MRTPILMLMLAASAIGEPLVENVAIPAMFEPNLGQAPAEARFVGRGAGWAASFTEAGAAVAQGELLWTMRFEDGANPPEIAGQDRRSSRSGYFQSPNREDWVADVPHFEEVVYRGVYPGVDTVFRAAGQQLEYDFHVAPGASLATIALRFEGPDRVEVDESGDLLLRFGDEMVRHRRPLAFQGEAEVEARFVVRPDGAVGFEADAYDAELPLVIDPLVYSTFIGGSAGATATMLTVSDGGIVYVGGGGSGIDFPTTDGSSATSSGGGFVAKIDPNRAGRESLRYLAFLGFGAATAGSISGGGVLYLATSNTGAHPTTENAVQADPAGDTDAFIVGLDLDKPRDEVFVYSSYFGGSGTDSVTKLAIDSRGRIVLGGRTSSTDFPQTVAAFTAGCPVQTCQWIAAIDPMQAGPEGLIASTYVPTESILFALDSKDRIHVAGRTVNQGLPTPNGAQTNCRPTGNGSCAWDVFYLLVDPATPEALPYATYFGGSDEESIEALYVDHLDRAWIAGSTESLDIPGEAPTPADGCPDFGPDCTSLFFDDAFVAGFDPALTGEASRLFAARLGGSRNDASQGVAYTRAGRLLLAGTAQDGFPVTADAYSAECQAYPNQDRCRNPDLFVAELDPWNPNGQHVRYSSLLGGLEHESWKTLDQRSGVFEDGGSLVGVVQTRSVEFPTAPGSFDRVQPLPGSRLRSVVLRFDARLPGQKSLVYASNFGESERTGAQLWTYANGRLYLLSSTRQPDLTTTPNAFDRTCAFGQVDRRGDCPQNVSLAIFDPRPGATLEIEPGEVELEYVIPDAAPEPIPLTISAGDPALRYRLKAESEGDWLRVEPAEAAGDATASAVVDVSRLTPRFPRVGRVILESDDPPLRRSVVVTVAVDAREPGAIAAVLHAASFEDRAVAPGQIVTIFGENMGTLGGLSTSLDDRSSREAPRLTSIPHTTVRFGQWLAPVLFGRHNQINVVVPYEIAGERVTTVTVETGKGRSPGFGLTVEPTAPALFTSTGTGAGQAAALNEDGTLNSPDRPAAPGSVIVLYGTGEGVTEPASRTWSVAAGPLPAPVTAIGVEIGGRAAPVLYAGPAPGFAGLFQINARLPDDVTGDAVPVVVRAGQAASPANVTVSVR